MKITENTVADIDFIVTDKDGKVIDTNHGDKPFAVLIGHGSMVPGLEEALLDHEPGDQINCVVPPEKAYGVRNDNLVQVLDKSMFGDNEPQVDDVFLADTDLGPAHIRVTKVCDNEVFVDGNHPLAGETLHFVVDVIAVREATASEIDHGHVHEDGKCSCEHDHEDGEHKCCGRHHHHDEDGEHNCCGRHHHHDEDSEHNCCGRHHHHDEDSEHNCCGRHHHHDEDGEHKCCGKHNH